MPLRSLWCLPMVLALVAVSLAEENAAPRRPIRIVLVGDSTVASYAKPPKEKPDLTGWGQVFGDCFNDRVTILNHAQSGRSTVSFIREGLWQKALAAKGDYIFVQFGHNDSHLKDGKPAVDPATTFQDYLRQYIDEARASSAKPVLVTPVARRTFVNGRIHTALQPYADAMLMVGKEKNVPVIDLHAAGMALFDRLGDEGSADLTAAANDRTHFSRKGAQAVARLVAERLAKAVPELQPYLKVAATASPAARNDRLWVYVGTYTKTPDAGINFCQLDLASGQLTKPVVVAKAANPSFLALGPRLPRLYAISEVSEFGKKKGGSVSAYRIRPKTGQLDLLNQQSTGGPGTCYVSVDRSGQAVLVANYGGGSVASLPIRPDGGLDPAATVDQHHGSSVHPSRQTGPFAHCLDADPANRFALSADLGIDKVMIYRLNAAQGTLTANDPAFVAVPPGTGPRHVTFHPNGRFVYLVNELNCTISLFRYDSTRGNLEPLQNLSTLPAAFAGENTAAEIQMHPSGRFLYSSNRGHDSIAIFAVDPDSGKLRSLGHQSTLGKAPRHFAIDPSGRYLLAANQESGKVVVFRVDLESGLLDPTGNSVAIPMPVCVVMLRPLE